MKKITTFLLGILLLSSTVVGGESIPGEIFPGAGLNILQQIPSLVLITTILVLSWRILRPAH
jgi:hypothetical protein